ncbi:hypothetical protein [Rhodobacter sp. TJ_12]|uniref:hypothetical protein n=1 Tax=Rhodobacter sp. TJ_12 TaxID=2029399 RepID=UPI001CBAE921|nr:hypothetical protein [Rhodobacter sp. TJ_12]
MTSSFFRQAQIAFLAACFCAGLAGCTEPVAQCEGGVEDLSTLSNVVVENPC